MSHTFAPSSTLLGAQLGALAHNAGQQAGAAAPGAADGLAASMLFDSVQQANDTSLATLLDAARNGVAELTAKDPKFDAFAKSLFGPAAAQKSARELMAPPAAERFASNLHAFLRMLAPHFGTSRANKCLEFLMRAYRVHVRDLDALMAMAMPMHETPAFARLLRCVDERALAQHRRWSWLRPCQRAGAPLARETLLSRVAAPSDHAELVRWFAETARTCMRDAGNARWMSLFVSTAHAALNASTNSAAREHLVRALLPTLHAGLGGPAQPGSPHSRFQSACATIAVHLAHGTTPLADAAINALVIAISRACSSAHAPAHSKMLVACLASVTSAPRGTAAAFLPTDAYVALSKQMGGARLVRDLTGVLESYPAERVAPLVHQTLGSLLMHARDVSAGRYARATLRDFASLMGHVKLLPDTRRAMATECIRVVRLALADSEGESAQVDEDVAAVLETMTDVLRTMADAAPDDVARAVDAALTTGSQDAKEASGPLSPMSGEESSVKKKKRRHKHHKASAEESRTANEPLEAFLQRALGGGAAAPIPGFGISASSGVTSASADARKAALKQLAAAAAPSANGTTAGDDEEEAVADAAAGISPVQVATAAISLAMDADAAVARAALRTPALWTTPTCAEAAMKAASSAASGSRMRADASDAATVAKRACAVLATHIPEANPGLANSCTWRIIDAACDVLVPSRKPMRKAAVSCCVALETCRNGVLACLGDGEWKMLREWHQVSGSTGEDGSGKSKSEAKKRGKQAAALEPHTVASDRCEWHAQGVVHLISALIDSSPDASCFTAALIPPPPSAASHVALLALTGFVTRGDGVAKLALIDKAFELLKLEQDGGVENDVKALREGSSWDAAAIEGEIGVRNWQMRAQSPWMAWRVASRQLRLALLNNAEESAWDGRASLLRLWLSRALVRMDDTEVRAVCSLRARVERAKLGGEDAADAAVASAFGEASALVDILLLSVSNETSVGELEDGTKAEDTKAAVSAIKAVAKFTSTAATSTSAMPLAACASLETLQMVILPNVLAAAHGARSGVVRAAATSALTPLAEAAQVLADAVKAAPAETRTAACATIDRILQHGSASLAAPERLEATSLARLISALKDATSPESCAATHGAISVDVARAAIHWTIGIEAAQRQAATPSTKARGRPHKKTAAAAAAVLSDADTDKMAWSRYMRDRAMAMLNDTTPPAAAAGLAEIADCMLVESADINDGSTPAAAAPARLALANAAARRAMAASSDEWFDSSLDFVAARAVASAPLAAAAAIPSILLCLRAAAFLPQSAASAASTVPRVLQASGAGSHGEGKLVELVEALLAVIEGGEGMGMASDAADASLRASVIEHSEMARALCFIIYDSNGKEGAHPSDEAKSPEARLRLSCKALEFVLRLERPPAGVADAAHGLVCSLLADGEVGVGEEGGADISSAQDTYAICLCFAALEACCGETGETISSAACISSLPPLLLRVACDVRQASMNTGRCALRALRGLAQVSPSVVAPHAVDAAVAAGRLGLAAEEEDVALADAALREALIPWLQAQREAGGNVGTSGRGKRQKSSELSNADACVLFILDVLKALPNDAIAHVRDGVVMYAVGAVCGGAGEDTAAPAVAAILGGLLMRQSGADGSASLLQSSVGNSAASNGVRLAGLSAMDPAEAGSMCSTCLSACPVNVRLAALARLVSDAAGTPVESKVAQLGRLQLQGRTVDEDGDDEMAFFSNDDSMPILADGADADVVVPRMRELYKVAWLDRQGDDDDEHARNLRDALEELLPPLELARCCVGALEAATLSLERRACDTLARLMDDMSSTIRQEEEEEEEALGVLTTACEGLAGSGGSSDRGGKRKSVSGKPETWYRAAAACARCARAFDREPAITPCMALLPHLMASDREQARTERLYAADALLAAVRRRATPLLPSLADSLLADTFAASDSEELEAGMACVSQLCTTLGGMLAKAQLTKVVEALSLPSASGCAGWDSACTALARGVAPRLSVPACLTCLESEVKEVGQQQQQQHKGSSKRRKKGAAADESGNGGIVDDKAKSTLVLLKRLVGTMGDVDARALAGDICSCITSAASTSAVQCDAAADALADTLAKLSSEDAAAHLTKLEMDDMLSLNLSLTLAQRLGSVVLELVGPWILDVVARGVANSDSAAEVVLLAHEASASLLDLESTRKLEEDGDCLRKLGNAECLVSLATGCLREHAWDEARFTEALGSACEAFVAADVASPSGGARWKTLLRRMLTCVRDCSGSVFKLRGLSCVERVVRRLNEEVVLTVPELVPPLAELLESDSGGAVSKAAKRVVSLLEDLSGIEGLLG
ncbi:HEAT repeat-containing protein 1 [Pycnococcus provasolii]|uniref:HEAT repeat-containing protein 1 n=3 Tax=Pycnococcus provasolii TaxID=41880 RepID=A0A830HN34_9CHLO|nr:HEAT repeat-containing protein 1 [Pycnococcus provasolii]